jgi:D-alanine-D-alanine ligase
MKKIAVVCGGYSGEYEISVQSAKVVVENIDKAKYKPYQIFIEKDNWFHRDDLGKIHEVDKNDFSLKLNEEHIQFDGVFNAIHGSPGEDGKLIGYFEMLNIPVTSCNSDTSSLTFNKYLCNNFVKSLGVNLARSLSFISSDKIDYDRVIKEIGLPLFVKPSKSGSSVGVSKVKSPDQLQQAIELAFSIDSRILIEEFLEGREIDCGVFRIKNELIVLPLTEIKPVNEFFDYESKYTKGKADEITPPVDLDPKFEMEIKATSSLIYNKLDCKGIVRLDYILTGSGLYFVEINSVPGFSAASIVPQQSEAMGIPISKLFNLALDEMFDLN